MNHRGPVRLRALAASAVLAIVALVGGPALSAQADDTATDLLVEGTLHEDGELSINETFTFGNDAPDQLVQRIDTTQATMDYTDYRYSISDVGAVAGGALLESSVTTDGDYVVITVDTAQAAGQPITIVYKVRGAAHAEAAVPGQDDGVTTIAWNVLQGLNVGVAQASGTIAVPGVISTINCRAGAPASPGPCKLWSGGTHDSYHPYFETDAVGAGGVIALSFSLPSSVVSANEQLDERWTLDRAMSTEPAPLIAALATLLLGAAVLFLLGRRLGADAGGNADPAIVADFEPVAQGVSRFTLKRDVRPGQIGTVLDERIDPVDVTATVLDLAVRGHLLITELPSANAHGQLDWRLDRREGGDELLDYERTLLDALAPVGGAGTVVSQISEPVESVIPTVQDQLYANVVERGWFAHRPDATRNRWATIGWAALALAVVVFVLLLIFTKFGLLGLALIALAGGVLYLSTIMPRRTASGSALLKGLDVLSMHLRTQPTNQVPKEDAYGEISRILPYTVVLGGKERWLDAMAAADDDPDVPDPDDLSWYHAPGDWTMADLPVALKAFVTTMQGELYGRS